MWAAKMFHFVHYFSIFVIAAKAIRRNDAHVDQHKVEHHDAHEHQALQAEHEHHAEKRAEEVHQEKVEQHSQTGLAGMLMQKLKDVPGAVADTVTAVATTVTDGAAAAVDTVANGAPATHRRPTSTTGKIAHEVAKSPPGALIRKTSQVNRTLEHAAVESTAAMMTHVSPSAGVQVHELDKWSHNHHRDVSGLIWCSVLSLVVMGYVALKYPYNDMREKLYVEKFGANTNVCGGKIQAAICYCCCPGCTFLFHEGPSKGWYITCCLAEIFHLNLCVCVYLFCFFDAQGYRGGTWKDGKDNGRDVAIGVNGGCPALEMGDPSNGVEDAEIERKWADEMKKAGKDIVGKPIGAW